MQIRPARSTPLKKRAQRRPARVAPRLPPVSLEPEVDSDSGLDISKLSLVTDLPWKTYRSDVAIVVDDIHQVYTTREASDVSVHKVVIQAHSCCLEIFPRLKPLLPEDPGVAGAPLQTLILEMARFDPDTWIEVLEAVYGLPLLWDAQADELTHRVMYALYRHLSIEGHELVQYLFQKNTTELFLGVDALDNVELLDWLFVWMFAHLDPGQAEFVSLYLRLKLQKGPEYMRCIHSRLYHQISTEALFPGTSKFERLLRWLFITVAFGETWEHRWKDFWQLLLSVCKIIAPHASHRMYGILADTVLFAPSTEMVSLALYEHALKLNRAADIWPVPGVHNFTLMLNHITVDIHIYGKQSTAHFCVNLTPRASHECPAVCAVLSGVQVRSAPSSWQELEEGGLNSGKLTLFLVARLP